VNGQSAGPELSGLCREAQTWTGKYARYHDGCDGQRLDLYGRSLGPCGCTCHQREDRCAPRLTD
jgi:hypothetical protein